MYRNSYQRGMLTIFYSVGSKPLNIWDTFTQDGYITRFLDPDIKSMVLEIGGTNVSTTYMVCPKGNQVLGITMPFLVMIVKNLKKYFTFEVTILDETGTRRRFRVSNFQSSTQILPLCTVMPIGLSDGWNQIQFNLAEFTRRAYKKQFVEVQKLKINANIRLRRIYFTERLIPEEQLPPEYKLYFPLATKGVKGKKVDKENVEPTTSQLPTGPVIEKKESKVEVSQEGTKETEQVERLSQEKVQLPSEGAETETKPEVSAPVEDDEVAPVGTPADEHTEGKEDVPKEINEEENKEQENADLEPTSKQESVTRTISAPISEPAPVSESVPESAPEPAE